MSASWLMAGNGLRRGSDEPAEFSTSVKEVVTLLVNLKTRGKAGLHTTFEAWSDRGHASGDVYPLRRQGWSA